VKNYERGVNASYLINPYPANVENKVSSYNASKWQMGFNSAFKGLNAKLNPHLPFAGIIKSSPYSPR
jgi:hypothetical protein